MKIRHNYYIYLLLLAIVLCAGIYYFQIKKNSKIEQQVEAESTESGIKLSTKYSYSDSQLILDYTVINNSGKQIKIFNKLLKHNSNAFVENYAYTSTKNDTLFLLVGDSPLPVLKTVIAHLFPSETVLNNSQSYTGKIILSVPVIEENLYESGSGAESLESGKVSHVGFYLEYTDNMSAKSSENYLHTSVNLQVPVKTQGQYFGRFYR